MEPQYGKATAEAWPATGGAGRGVEDPWAWHSRRQVVAMVKMRIPKREVVRIGSLSIQVVAAYTRMRSPAIRRSIFFFFFFFICFYL
ncbi:uncharacterized protein Dana_GF26544, partial [Drosophila ananassae]